jgi:hypothetical protein
LAESASGLRHLRWAREIHATLEAHAENASSPEERGLCSDQAQALAAAIATAREPVKAYRDFLERVRVKSRGRLRAAAWRGEPEALERARAAHELLETGECATLKADVRAAVRGLRDAIVAIIEQVEAHSSRGLAASLLPELTADRQRVIDRNDEDDDASSSA